MLKTFKYRLYPTAEQAVLLNKHMNACRFVYNLALETKNYAYLAHRKNLSRYDLMKQLTDLKKQEVWLSEVSIESLQQAIVSLDNAYTGFFKLGKGFPKYKSKAKSAQTFKNTHGESIKIKGDKVSIPKFRSGIKMAKDRPLIGNIRSTVTSKTKTGKYFISILCETGEVTPEKKKITVDSAIGIDLGIKSYIATSDGELTDNPKYLKNSRERLTVLQRRASRKKKGSKNRWKANRKVALLHEKISNQRRDFQQKLSTSIIKRYDTICTESLNIDGMMKNHNLAGSIGDAGWGVFIWMLRYKCEWYGNNLLQIPTFQASTKVCSNCGVIKTGLSLSDREWSCECGVVHDRDINAAKVIKQYCLNNSGQVLPGEPVEPLTLVGVMKQEGRKSTNTAPKQ